MSLSVEVIRSVEAFNSLEGEWRELVEQSVDPNPFLTWEWMRCWWDCFGQSGHPWILTARDERDGTLVGVAPFALCRRPFSAVGLYRELSFMGCTRAAPDHLDVLARPGDEGSVSLALVDQLLEHRRQWDVLRLDGIASGSPLVQALEQRNELTATFAWPVVCPYLPLPVRWEDYLSKLDRKVRYNLRSRARRLEKDAPAPVTFETVCLEKDVQPAMSSLFRLHQRVREAHGDKGAFCHPSMLEFHCSVAKRFHRNGWLRIHFLKVSEQRIAGVYCFRYGEVVYFYQTGYDRDWSRYGPGAAIVAYAIRASIEEGAREFDFLRGDEPYKFQWTDLVRRDLKMRIASSARGRLLVWGRQLARGARRRLKAWRTA